MSAIHTKSLTGITSITTPSGIHNVFTVHSNDTTERFRVDLNGNQSIAGILTVAQDLDVDGHTNLDNVSISGVTTASDNIIIPDDKKLILGTQSGRQLHLYHNLVGSSNHVIESTSSSNHFILKASVINPRANYFSFRNLAHNQNVFIIDADNSTKLYFNGNEKLTTENTGVNITGIVTATSYRGDGSQLTGISGVTINNNADNRIITGSGTAATLNGESNLTFDGTNLLLNGKILKFDNVSSTPSASGNVHIYAHDTKLKMCGGSGIQFEEGGFTRWHITSGALHPHGTTYNNLGNSSNRVGNAYIQTSVDLIDSAELRLGNSDDLQIYHSTFNYIESHNDTEIHINAYTGGSAENMAKFKPNGAVELYHNGSLKLDTRSSGVGIGGDLFFVDSSRIYMGSSMIFYFFMTVQIHKS